MVPPGLLPETTEPRPSPLKWIVGLLSLAFLLSVGFCFLMIARLARQRDEERARVNQLVEMIRKTAISRPPAPDPSTGPAPQPAPSAPSPAPADPPRAPDVRVVPPAPRDPAPERLTQGLHEFRSGRYLQAESHFFRALPEGYLYLALSALARNDLREAFGFLSRAIALDPQWLRKVRPRDLFAADADYLRLVEALEGRLAENPLDLEAKTLLAYFRFHDRGAPYAKALLLEVTNAKSDHEEARQFLETLDR